MFFDTPLLNIPKSLTPTSAPPSSSNKRPAPDAPSASSSSSGPVVNLDRLLKKMKQESAGTLPPPPKPQPKKQKKDSGKDNGWPTVRETRVAKGDRPLQRDHNEDRKPYAFEKKDQQGGGAQQKGGKGQGQGGKGHAHGQGEKTFDSPNAGAGDKPPRESGALRRAKKARQSLPNPSTSASISTPTKRSSPPPAAAASASSPPPAASTAVSATPSVTLTPGMVLMPFAGPTQTPTASFPATLQAAGKKGGNVQDKLRAQLAGGKFRMLNETLYTTTGGEGYRLMKDDGAFDDYHIGFRSQAATWPVHPLALIAQSLVATLPALSLIADFGCGDAALARSLSSSPSSSSAGLPPIPSLKLPTKKLAEKNLKVLSYDLVSQNSYVVEAECSSVPLPGGHSGGEVVDAVVCCLSLMGTDWVGMVREARRVLREGGILKIAEVTSRFPSVDDFIKLLTSMGWELKHKDDSNTHFLLLDFVKVSSAHGVDGEGNKREENGRKAEKLLNPCIYKRR